MASFDLGTPEGQSAYLEHLRAMLEERMADRKKRYAHSLGVSRTAGELAGRYGVDPFLARAAGLLHDWDKVVPDDELLVRALHYGIAVQGDPARSLPVLHGPVAARELPGLFPELPAEVFQAIDRHTLGAPGMSPLDMVVFVADGIEPGRRGDYVDKLRRLAATAGLEELFFACLSSSLAYVIQTGRYLNPQAIETYDAYAH